MNFSLNDKKFQDESERWLTEYEVAAMTSMSVHTLRSHRQLVLCGCRTGFFPEYHLLHIVYGIMPFV